MTGADHRGEQIQLSFDAPITDPASGAPPRHPHVRWCAPRAALSTLADAIHHAKAGDPLAPVTVVVSTNIAGVMARRSLGRHGGVLAVDVVTLGRVAELLAGPSLAAERRQPISDPVIDLTIADVLADAPGLFAPVARHQTTVTALRRAHQELRLSGDAGVAALRERGTRAAEVARVSTSVAMRLRRHWYDEADVVARATELIQGGMPAGLRQLIVHLPQRLDPASAGFAARLAAGVPTQVVAATTGDAAADAGVRHAVRQLGGAPSDESHPDTIDAPTRPVPIRPAAVITTTDADDEVRVAVRQVIDAARGELTGSPVPFERIGVFWPAHVPYARLVEHHLEVNDLTWNGRGGIAVTERIAPRLLLELLQVDQRRFRRSDLFDLLADVPPRDPDGRHLPVAEWHRVARALGISDGADWQRLRTVDAGSRWAQPAADLAAFVEALRARLGSGTATRTWREWTDWSAEQLTGWLGPRAEMRLSDAEYRGWEALMTTLDRLRSLDRVAAPPTRSRFRQVLHAELDQLSVRAGRIGTGIVTGSLASAPGLDLDVAVVVGAADGVLPPPPAADPMLSDDDRHALGLAPSTDRATRLHHALHVLADTTTAVVTVPRGDLRTTAQQRASRWLDHTAEPTTPVVQQQISSSIAGLAATAFPVGERERRLRDRVRATSPGTPRRLEQFAEFDTVLRRALAMRAGRAAPRFTEYDGDLTGVVVPTLGERPVSPTQLQTWASCPHAYFNRYLLGVRPVEEVDRDLSIRALDAGTLQHEVLDRFHRDVLAGRLDQPVDGWTDAHRAALLAHFDTVADETERRGRTGRPATWFAERTRLRDELTTWLDHDDLVVRANGVTVVSSELDFGRPPPPEAPHDQQLAYRAVSLALPGGREIPVFGSADRVDRWSDGTLVVTDHKTGKDRYRRLDEHDPTLEGTVFQLPAYAAAARTLLDAPTQPDQRHPPVRAEYSLFGRGQYARRGLSFTPDVWELVSEELAEIVDGIEHGWFPARPQRPGWRLFVECEHCDPDHIGTDDAWARWAAKRSDPRAARWFADPVESGADTGRASGEASSRSPGSEA